MCTRHYILNTTHCDGGPYTTMSMQWHKQSNFTWKNTKHDLNFDQLKHSFGIGARNTFYWHAAALHSCKG